MLNLVVSPYGLIVILPTAPLSEVSEGVRWWAIGPNSTGIFWYLGRRKEFALFVSSVPSFFLRFYGLVGLENKEQFEKIGKQDILSCKEMEFLSNITVFFPVTNIFSKFRWKSGHVVTGFFTWKIHWKGYLFGVELKKKKNTKSKKQFYFVETLQHMNYW